MLIAYCEARNWELVDIYCSGAGTFRPDFERLIKDCEKGLIDIVLCKSQSRFSRDMEVIEKYIHNKFLEWKIRFVGIVDNADTDNKGNKKARQINGLINDKSKKERGEFTGAFVPYGDIRSPPESFFLLFGMLKQIWFIKA